MREWYVLLSQFSATLGEPLRQFAGRINLPLVNAFVLGLIGATAPCQLTTNLSAVAYVSRYPGGGRVWQEATAYTLGKLLVYTLIGGTIIGLGQEIQGAAVAVAFVTRKLLGPLMLLIGLVFLHVLRFRLLAYGGLVALGSSLAERYVQRLARGHAPVRKIAGVIFILVGINDTLTYWFL